MKVLTVVTKGLRFAGFTTLVLAGMVLWLTWLPLMLLFRDWMDR